MPEHTFEIEITPEGDVKVHIKGVKGAKCEEYAKLFAEVIGELKSSEKTHEYFEQEDFVNLNLKSVR